MRQRVSNETSNDEQINLERKLLEQRLEEAHLHLADIKTSWSDKIASLETQVLSVLLFAVLQHCLWDFKVGRLSRQAAEESAERRRAVQEKERLLERVTQMEVELECNRLELNNKETKIKRLTADVEEMAAEIKALRAEAEEEVAFLRSEIVS